MRGRLGDRPRGRGPQVHRRCGDGDLPTAGGSSGGARCAGAAREALARIAKLEALPDHPDARIEIALALHQGEVMYANVGVAGRLDFTVTGPAVNQVARLESLSKALGRPVVASAAFAECGARRARAPRRRSS